MHPVPFESFTYPFFDFSTKVNYSTLVDSYLNSEIEHPNHGKGNKSLYVHIPFCDTICNFCPFIKSVANKERIDKYVLSLCNEIRLVSQKNRIKKWSLDSIYFGGGTPSVLNLEQIELIFNTIKENFVFKSNIEITFELEAKSADREKLLFLKNKGVTRVSFGLQTFDPKIRDLVNLTASNESLIQTIDLFNEIFPDANNMDLMVGFPGQSKEQALFDVEKAAKSGISSISIYPVDYVVTLSNLIEKIRSGVIPPPLSPTERRSLFFESRQILKSHFAEYNMYSYGTFNSIPSKHMFSNLYSSYYNEYIGVGCGAYSGIQGLVYQNNPNEDSYNQFYNSADYLLSINNVHPYHAYEKGLVFFPKILKFDWQEAIDLNIADLYSPLIENLIKEGYILNKNNTLTLSTQGELEYAELMSLFFSDSQRRLYNGICDKFVSVLGWDGETSFFEKPIFDKKMGALRAM